MNWKDFSKKKRLYILMFACIVGILLWAFISASVITHNFSRSQLSGEQDRQEAQINGIILTETKNEKKYWEIYGETGNYDSKTGIAMLDNVIGNFYGSNNDVAMSFESTKGTYNANKKQIILYEHTKIAIKDGTMLYADRLVWSGNDKPVVATGNIKIVRNKQFLATATKAVINPGYQDFKITGKTVSRIYDIKEQKWKKF